MKYLILATFLIFSAGLIAQNELIEIDQFIRVYDREYKLLSKGKFKSVSETSLVLKRHREAIIIPAESIIFIKTKPSKARSVIIGSAIGAVIFGLIGEAAATDNPDGFYLFSSREEKWIAGTLGFFVGAGVGAGVGALAHPNKKSKTFYVNGEIEKLRALTRPKMPSEHF